MAGIEAGNRFDPHALTVAVAINGNSKSEYHVRWALDKFASEEHVVFVLLHVRARMGSLPTPLGDSIPISRVGEDVAAVYKNETDGKTGEMILPYKKIFVQNEVQLDIVVIESDDVVNAISQAVNKHKINKLVIGASSSNLFTRKLKKNYLSARISDNAPRFCTVYVVSKGKLLSTRPSEVDTRESIRDDTSEISWCMDSQSTCTSSPRIDSGSLGFGPHFRSPSLTLQRFHALSTVNQTIFHGRACSNNTNHNRCTSLDVEESSSWRTSKTDDQTSVSYQDSNSSGYSDSYSSGSQMNVDFELEKLKIELRHARGMYAMAQTEIRDASEKLSDLNQLRLEEATKLKELELMEEEAKELAKKEKGKHKAAINEAEHVRECVEREASQRREAEIRTEEEAKEKERLENALVGPLQQYVKFTWEEIVAATSSFSEDLKIGMGAYGSVYKCNLHHTTVAVKVLHSDKSNMAKQFDQELEILSKIRHPHLLLLLGACPERGCLIYEYMQNGSLDERLLKSNNPKPLPWFERYRIAREVASALNFLHTTKPKPIVHRDLKPANILLDHNLVSKIGDVGLSKMVNLDPSYVSTLYKDTGLVGTLFYIDPEYQRTGLVSPESDVYAFGIIILQLVTAKPAMGLAHTVEKAVRDGKLVEIFDSEAGSWSMDETRELAILGLRCTELRRKDRPDLESEVLPLLERLQDVADRAKNSVSRNQAAAPYHFICPILKEVMKNPCVASDGYTYDRRAIEEWLEQTDQSPMTNLPLPNKSLVPNYTLLSAIMEWKSNHQ